MRNDHDAVCADEDLVGWLVDNETDVLRQAMQRPDTLADFIRSRASRSLWYPGAVINAAACAVGLMDRYGRLLASTPQYDETGLKDSFSLSAFRSLAQGVRFARIQSCGVTRLVFVASADSLGSWSIPVAWREAARKAALVVIIPLFRSKHTLRYACDSLGLSPAQARVLVATVTHGSIREGSLRAGVSYQRARALVSQALSMTGDHNLTALVRRLVSVSLGLIPNSLNFSSLVKDIWGLNERQVSLMGLVAAGVDRQQAATVLGMSHATAKKEMTMIYETLGIKTSVDLSVVMSEHIMLSLLQGSTIGVREFADLHTEPLTFLRREDGSRIAISDYGPSGGLPVIYIHSSMTSRPTPKRLRLALAKRGFRVISVDRPGYGLSDSVAGHPFRAAAADLEAVRYGLGLDQPLAIARGGAQVLLELARMNPAALRAAMVINPDPRTPYSAARHGPIGAFKELFLSSPAVISLTAKIFSSRLNKADLGEWLLKSVRGSAMDEHVANQEDVRADYWRMVRSFATGAISGYIAEQTELARHGDEPLTQDSWRWRFIIGSQDTLHDPLEARAYWQSRVPAACFDLVEDGGRLLAFSHADYLAEQLASLAQPV